MSLWACLSRLPGNRARPVLRGPGRSNASRLPDERWFADLTGKAIRRGVFRSVPDLIAAIEAYLTAYNNDPKPLIWTATAEDILAKVRRGRVTLNQLSPQN